MRLILGTGVVLVSLFAASTEAYTQGLRPEPSAEECQQWAAALEAGGAQAMDALTFGAISLCPTVAPSVLTNAIRKARKATDIKYLELLAIDAGDVRDPAVFRAALDLAADRGASDRARIMGLLVIVAHLGSEQYIPDWTRTDLFTRELPAEGICVFGFGGYGPAIDNGLPGDYEREAARVIDSIRYRNGESRFVRSFARCARSAVDPEIPPQVDTRKIRVDYVCETTFRIQNHTGVELLVSYVLTDAAGNVLEDYDVGAPAKGGWTMFDVDTLGTLTLSYDGEEIGRAVATGKPCGGRKR